MVKLIGISLLSALLLLSCHVGNGNKPNKDTPAIPYELELNEAIDFSQAKAIATSFDFSCILDKAGHPRCWANPKKFIPGSDPAHRGAFAMDYPKKKNKDLAAHKFVNVVYDGPVCAVRDDGKVLCFEPDSVSSITTDKLNYQGPFAKVATTSNARICVIDKQGTLACFELDLKSNNPRDHYIVDEKIAEFAMGSNSKGAFGCWISTSGLLKCEALDTSSTKTASNLDVFKLARGPSDDFAIATLSGHQDFIHFFGYNQKSAINKFGKDERTMKFMEIAITQKEIVCGVLEETHELKCGGKSPAFLKSEDIDLEKQVFTQISISRMVGCGLRPDKIISCWRMENLLTGIPSELRISE